MKQYRLFVLVLCLLFCFCGCATNTAESDSSVVDQNENTSSLSNDVVTSQADGTIHTTPSAYPLHTKTAFLYNSLDDMLKRFELNGTNEFYTFTDDTLKNVKYYSMDLYPDQEQYECIDCLLQNGLYNISYDGKAVEPVNDELDYGYAIHFDIINNNVLSRYRFKIDTEYGECELFLTAYCDYEEKPNTLEEFVEQYRSDTFFRMLYNYGDHRDDCENIVDINIDGKTVECLTSITYDEVEEKYVFDDHSGNFTPYYMFISPFSDNVLFHISFKSSVKFELIDTYGDWIPDELADFEVAYTGYDWLSKFDFEKVDIGVNYDMLYELYDPQKWLDQQYQ